MKCRKFSVRLIYLLLESSKKRRAYKIFDEIKVRNLKFGEKYKLRDPRNSINPRHKHMMEATPRHSPYRGKKNKNDCRLLIGNNAGQTEEQSINRTKLST